MKNKKKQAQKQAKNAKRLLKTEKKDYNNSNKSKMNMNKEMESDSKRSDRESKRLKKRQSFLSDFEANMDKKREEILLKNNTELLKKFDLKRERIRTKWEIKEIDRLNQKPKGLKSLPNSSNKVILNVSNVTKSYTTKTLVFNALNDVSFNIQRGEFVVILGPSGSGKSTLLNVISGLDRPTHGEIIIDGKNLVALTDREMTALRREKIGFVFQSYNLLSTLNVSDNVEIGRSLQKNKQKRLNINDVLNSMNMMEQSKKRTYELSGGEQQRVSIARAVAKSPDILIGDEPTGALDSKSRTQVFKIFQDLNKNEKTTIIIVTHNQQIAKLANKVINVKDGRIEKITINKKVMKAENLRE